MEQAAVSDGEFLDLFPPFDDGCAPPEVDVGGGEIAEAFMVSTVVVMLDEGVDMAVLHQRHRILVADTVDRATVLLDLGIGDAIEREQFLDRDIARERQLL